MASKTNTFQKLLPAIVVLCAVACKKDEPKGNRAPETQISISEINLSGEDRLNSTVSLSWFGTDPDGYVEGFEISFDNNEWHFTARQDSVFSFSLPPGNDTADIDFYVRAIDNEGLVDPSPAYLSVPLKNTPPEASFNSATGPRDTALLVATFSRDISDPDGDQSITSVEIKVNDGEWHNISLNEEIFSFVLDPATQQGDATAALYYGTSTTPDVASIDGFQANGQNTLYIRATDIAGAQSEEDTSDTFYLKSKTAGTDLLWISGQNQTVTNGYGSILNNINISYDQLNYGTDGATMPSYWNITFNLLARHYPKMFVNAGQTTYTNRVTGQTKTLLEFMAPTIQNYTQEGGKYFVTTSFNKDKELSEISGPYPVESLVSSSGQARIQPDSALVPVLSGNFPDLQPSSVQSGVVPIVPSENSEAFYRAQLLKLAGWTGTEVVAAVRRPNNVWTEVFFAVELHNFDQDPQNTEQLFREILINEF